ncbi:NAD(P)H-binding protein [Albimonas sp. CAU 1670]|uniref:NAD(P)H-binding protein n=1 Tax=Albimonas sp. CAU 1670 TaxID=3032599 RepID=UPI0023DC3F72|nr:NAD(P)H-binding protein [Albimonas sp. CAU 1670]MDF2234645.1 NAD(P)H-binding protein [Albimonas sp. CAU 1670]
MTQIGTALVVGARGRFGRHATAAFAEAGWRVRAMTRTGARGFENAEPVAGDALDPEALTRAAEDADVIVNGLNAPYPDWREALPRTTHALLTAAKATGATLVHPGNVYGYGSAIPARATPDTPYRPDTVKGRLRAEQEMRLRAAAEAGEIRCIVLRGGDFLDTEIAGNWFDSHMTAKLDAGRFVYPGPLDRVHAWSFLPDFAAVIAGLAARREALPPFAAFNHPGHALTGAELLALTARAAGRPLAPRPFPWWALRLAAPVWPMGRELVEMRYLWSTPHRLEDPRLAALLPEHVPHSAEAAVAAALAPRLEGRPGGPAATARVGAAPAPVAAPAAGASPRRPLPVPGRRPRPA